MRALVRWVFSPEADHLPRGHDRDRMVSYWAGLRDANPFALHRP